MPGFSDFHLSQPPDLSWAVKFSSVCRADKSLALGYVGKYGDVNSNAALQIQQRPLVALARQAGSGSDYASSVSEHGQLVQDRLYPSLGNSPLAPWD